MNLNYGVGGDAQGPTVVRNFFVFDLTGIGKPIASAELELIFTGYASPDSTETLTFFDITTPWEELLSGDAEVDGFNDLGSGEMYGDYVVSDAIEGIYFSVSLNAAAIGDMNGAAGLWGLGGAITTLDGNINNNEGLAIDAPWDADLTSTILVIETIPAPPAFAALAFGSLAFRKRRRR